MIDHAPLPSALLLLSIAALAALTDSRRGLIPNWLTLPPLLLTPLAHGIALGPGALGASLAGLALCGAVPLLLFARGSMGGGDVKLFAALGALAGPLTGLEVQIVALWIAALTSLALLAYRGELLDTLSRSLRRRATTAAPAASLQIRLGLPVFLAVAVCLAPVVLELP
ncbi:MAG: prepilin peptidase [Myxococcales bacterium]|jgi:prepilin peptidase CpaA